MSARPIVPSRWRFVSVAMTSAIPKGDDGNTVTEGAIRAWRAVSARPIVPNKMARFAFAAMMSTTPKKSAMMATRSPRVRLRHGSARGGLYRTRGGFAFCDGVKDGRMRSGAQVELNCPPIKACTVCNARYQRVAGVRQPVHEQDDEGATDAGGHQTGIRMADLETMNGW